MVLPTQMFRNLKDFSCRFLITSSKNLPTRKKTFRVNVTSEMVYAIPFVSSILLLRTKGILYQQFIYLKEFRNLNFVFSFQILLLLLFFNLTFKVVIKPANLLYYSMEDNELIQNLTKKPFSLNIFTVFWLLLFKSADELIFRFFQNRVTSREPEWFTQSEHQRLKLVFCDEPRCIRVIV